MISTSPDTETEEETISYYEVASYLYNHDLYNALTTDEFSAYKKQGRELTVKARPTK